MGGWYRFGYNLSKFLARTAFSTSASFIRERIIEEGGAILAMNHQSYLDPPLAGIRCQPRNLLTSREKRCFEWPVLGPIFPKINVVPVDQERADMSALKTVIRLVKAGHCTVVFPEGARTLDGNLQPAQPGLGLIIAKTLAPGRSDAHLRRLRSLPARRKYRSRSRPSPWSSASRSVSPRRTSTASGRDLYQTPQRACDGAHRRDSRRARELIRWRNVRPLLRLAKEDERMHPYASQIPSPSIRRR